MEIGKALYTDRLNLNLTQKQMCSGILSRPYYARVENGRSSISAENLFRILAARARNINFEEFYELIQDDYLSDLTQNDLAKLAGLTRQTIYLIENNRYNPTIALCLKLTKALSTDLDSLFFIEENKRGN